MHPRYARLDRADYGRTQYFKENPYFSDSVLKKEYRFQPSNASDDETPDADGVTPSMLDFSWERDVTPQVWTAPATFLAEERN